MPGRKTERNSEIRVSGRRTVLRSMTDEDIADVERWYREAAGAVHGLARQDDRYSVLNLHYQLEAAEADTEGGLLAIARRDDPAPIGLLDYRANSPAPGWLTVRFIAVAREYRGWGYGSEAVRLLEGEAARQWGAERFRAGVDVRNGLALYFWLRLGYRALHGPPGPGGAEDVIWMTREVA
ncbi:MAG: GNAT family N-acetyltransferase [Chloroflexi bacterium]|nr:GNAT family N-acetyltransferase [Chloroflexota bacterium]